jgi:HK97 family phage prohead protease
MPVEQCSNGKYRIGDGECVYTSRASAERAYRAYLAIEADEEDEDYEDDDKMKGLKEDTYNDYPEAATNNAKRALAYKEENGSTCGTPVGWTRARQLANRERISRDTIARMASFKRHQQNKDVPYDEGCGGIMWDAWGGDAGINWAISKLQQIDSKKTSMIYGYKRLSQDIKDVDAKKGIVTGYFSAFNIKDSDGDIILPGSFKRSIEEWQPKGRIKHLLNHDPRQPLGKITELREDSYGLYYESQIGKHNLGQDFIKMVESDLVKEHSIGFNIKGQRKAENANEIYDIVLYEGSSLTSWGANEYTPLLGLKTSDDRVQRIKRLEKFIKHSDATDETIELLMLEIKQLNQLVEDLSSQPASEEEPTEPKVDTAKAVKDALDILIYKHF